MHDYLVATRYEFLQSSHLFIYPISPPLHTNANIAHVRIENTKAGNQISKLLTRAKYEPSLTDCGPLPHEISLLMLIHEFVSLHQQIPTQRPFARNPNIIRMMNVLMMR